jgi:hypothetical protein
MSKFGKKLQKLSRTKIGGGINKLVGMTPGGMLGLGIANRINRKRGGVSSSPEAQEMSGIVSGPMTLPINENINNIPRSETIESKQANVTGVENDGDTSKKIVMDEEPTKATTENKKSADKPTPMEWLKKNWYIPVAIVVVLVGAWYFLKAKK